ncbi:choloylglycine hydrolase [Porcipelethomonas sp.]|uniref:choloylglycine hydrolase n=1 Tax=Porcipelethomonas sp. TaxID=2981675 RepID=UPI003EF1EFA8
MCTSIAMKTRDFYFGRNMDLDYGFGEHVVITPRNYPFEFRKAGMLKHHYAMIGMASVADNYPLYAEAVNEKGLCMAGLNFPENAYYPHEENCSKQNVSPFELIPWLLGKCACVEEVRKLLAITHVIAIPFSEKLPLATLHWHIADKNESIVLEVTKSGMHIYDNPVHVMTNDPTFDFHMTNLSQYLNLNVELQENCFYKSAGVKPFGKGLGSFGLPGDFSSASRFVKSAYLLLNSNCKDDEDSSVSQFFHLLDSVAVVNGSIITSPDKCYLTTYSCCANADKGIYYYKTYDNNQLTAVNMNHENLDSDCLKEFAMVKSQQVSWEN